MLEFPENYFRGEELEGFYVEEMMKRAWAALPPPFEWIAAAFTPITATLQPDSA